MSLQVGKRKRLPTCLALKQQFDTTDKACNRDR
jgi:hypothetical protein